jgi:hypothetical protein
VHIEQPTVDLGSKLGTARPFSAGGIGVFSRVLCTGPGRIAPIRPLTSGRTAKVPLKSGLLLYVMLGSLPDQVNYPRASGKNDEELPKFERSESLVRGNSGLCPHSRDSRPSALLFLTQVKANNGCIGAQPGARNGWPDVDAAAAAAPPASVAKRKLCEAPPVRRDAAAEQEAWLGGRVW